MSLGTQHLSAHTSVSVVVVNGVNLTGGSNFNNLKVTLKGGMMELEQSGPPSLFQGCEKVQRPDGSYKYKVKPKKNRRRETSKAYAAMVKISGKEKADAIWEHKNSGFNAGGNLSTQTTSPNIIYSMEGIEMVAGKDAVMKRTAECIMVVQEEDVNRQSGGNLTATDEASGLKKEIIGNTTHACGTVVSKISGDYGKITEIGTQVISEIDDIQNIEHFSVSSNIQRQAFDESSDDEGECVE